MAAKKTNWAAVLGVIGVIAAIWLLWPKKAGASGSGAGGGGPLQRLPIGSQQLPQSGRPAGSGTAAGSPGLKIPSFGGNPFTNWLKSLYAYGQQNIGSYYTDVSSLPGVTNSIDYQPLNLLNDLPSWTQNDPNAPWNSDTGANFDVTSNDSGWGIDSLAYQPLQTFNDLPTFDTAGGSGSSSDTSNSTDYWQAQLDQMFQTADSLSGGFGSGSISSYGY